MVNNRIATILDMLKSNHRITVDQLSERFNVSTVTARKDLARLEEGGYVVRTRGGAVSSLSFAAAKPIDARQAENPRIKAILAHKAASLIQDGDTVFLDSGTTMAALAGELYGRPIRILTHSLPVIEALRDDDKVSLFALGGMYSIRSRSFVGSSAVVELDRYSPDIAFIGASGVSSEGVLAAQSLLEADIKRKVLAIAKTSYIVVDSSKIDAASFAVFGRPDSYKALICDDGIEEEAVARLRGSGVELILVTADQLRGGS